VAVFHKEQTLAPFLRALAMAGMLTATIPSYAGTDQNPEQSTAADGWDFAVSAAELSDLCDNSLQGAREAFATIEQDSAPATLQRVYGAHDAMMLDLQAIQHVWYLKSVHPDTEVQAAAEGCIEDYSDFVVSMSLSPDFYRRVAAIDTASLSQAEKLMIEKRLRDFRQAGVDRDQATRDRVRALVAEITELGTQFDRTIREDRRFVEATPAQLAGLPPDFLDNHPVNDKGVVRLSTDYPDYFPVMKYGADDDLRRRLFMARMNIATPDNEKNLETLIKKRAELAALLGYDSHASLAMDGLMIENPDRAHAFLSEIAGAVQTPAATDMNILLQRRQKIDPGAEKVQAWQASHLSNLVRQEQYALDAREVREYFHFDRVQSGIFELTEDLFGVRIVPWETATWHQDVTAWEMREGNQAIGRFYLDMHPRANKYKHAAHWTLRTGLKDRQLPLSGMATNFPRGLMEHTQVETFLHEFGHLLHNMFSGTQQWLDISGMSMERDFVEAPSQMLEQWVWDYDTLRRFARNEQGEAIPRGLVEKMNRSRHFGEAAGIAGQLFYANLSLNYYNREPGSFELLPLLQELQARYSPLPYVEGTHFYNSFGHLNGYSSNYYIYQWSRAISTDLFSRFKTQGLRDRQTADTYRRKVLAPGGSKPAAEAVADFLGRPFSTDAYRDYLGQLRQQ
jgi:thimet oligopeptidase